ncbi:MAG: histone deacetylase [Saprospiraceae bacterium]
MRVAFDPIYIYELPPGHRFPMEKYELLPEQLMRVGVLDPLDFFAPGAMDESDILLTHSNDYWGRLKKQELTPREIRDIGFPMTPRLVERGRYIAQGTLDCAGYAAQDGISLNIAGGTHHAYAGRGEGFCVLNDIALATKVLLQRNPGLRILVVDLDVHQGNGTAHIFRHEPRVFTFSMHGARNYPLRKEKSDLDIGLPDGTTDGEYLTVLTAQWGKLLDSFRPDLVFYQAGVDVLAEDRLGRLNLTIAGCEERDLIVLSQCFRKGIPLVVTMGGGYPQRLSTLLDAHTNTFKVAKALIL